MSAKTVYCTRCPREAQVKGQAPPCPSCGGKMVSRSKVGKRSVRTVPGGATGLKR